MFHITQWVKGSELGALVRSCRAMAKLCVPAGTPVQSNCGETFAAPFRPVFSAGNKSHRSLSPSSGPQPATSSTAVDVRVNTPALASALSPASPDGPASPPLLPAALVPAEPLAPPEPAMLAEPAEPAEPPAAP